ncbi:xanthine dehydrogenase/oxidase-like isoform X2 [Portunus trituberculatus]|uniref:xanthine dehydrogenase/oxidase-like isoform X2 n=1 Tax=Portunus trituberculatus TaxID=210409 RepID=UPI001E1CCBD3|nr:xanthine dehydrogenase/oxidase-like isoform X2 [Portunus trituberculatus]
MTPGVVTPWCFLSMERRHYSVNACLTPVASLHGMAVTTVEGIGSTKTGLHAVQERLAKAHGSQCGFCTPGIVMSMYTLLRNNPHPTMAQLDEYFTGNLCRCTGYRPILDGYRSLTTSAGPTTCGKANCCMLNGGGCGNMNGQVNGGTEELDGELDQPGHHLYQTNGMRPYDPSQEIIFPPELKVRNDLERESLEFKGPRVVFHRPATLEQLLHLKDLHPTAKIIGGNTEVGVEVQYKNQLYPVLINPINVAELTSIEETSTAMVFGAAVTLTALEEALRDQVTLKHESRTRVFAAIIEMLRWFAGKQIRNAAAIGGNVMTASPISDLNPLLMAAGAILTLRSKNGGERQVTLDHTFFTGYRRTIVLPQEVLININIPFTQQNEYFFGYKQARRREDDIAIVNAGCKVVFRPDSIEVLKLDLAFGGMAPTTVMALGTMKELVGRKWDASLLEDGTSQLACDLPLAFSAPGGMVEYRRALTLSFFFKFYLSVRGQLSQSLPQLVAPLTQDEQLVVTPHQYTEPASSQVFQRVSPEQSKTDPIGRPIVHTSAFKQVTGEAVYVDDIPPFANELYAAFVISSHANAKILGIDESEALKIEGVERFICARDLSEERNQRNDHEVFASKMVDCIGQIVGIVVAKDQPTAQRAARLVRIDYEDVDTPIITIQDAIEKKSWWNKWTMKTGDAEAALKVAVNTLEGETHISGQEHFYMETNAHIAIPKGEDGEMEIISTTQNPSDTQVMVAKALGVAYNKVVCRIKRLGGGFGGKETRSADVSVPLCVAASIIGRPIRMMLDRHEDMVITGGRHPFLCRWRVGFTDQGVITAADLHFYANCGNTIDLSIGVVHRSLYSTSNAYNWPNLSTTGYACKTNLPSNTAFRGFGAPQGMFCSEDIMEHVAQYLHLDPRVVRERNFYKTGDTTHFGQVIERCTLSRCWKDVLDQSDYSTLRANVQKFNSEHTYRKRGVSVVPVMFSIAFTLPWLNQAGALVLVYRDGSVLLSHGGTEMGQGLHTKMIQVASRTLDIPTELIHISETATDKVPNTSPTAASVSSDINGMAVLEACEKIKERLKPVIAKDPKAGWKSWVEEAYLQSISLSATGYYCTPGIKAYNFETHESAKFNYFSYGAAVSEVEVDCLTGDHSVLQTDIVMDVGDSLNPAIDVGQVEGAFMQGLGLFTLEELRYSPSGVLLTRGPGAYKIPGFQSIPQKLSVSLLRDAPNPRAVFSSKAVGEPPLFLAASVFFAIRNAVEAARKDHGLENIFRFDSPATAEHIRMACQDFLTEKIEPAVSKGEKPWSVTV